MYKLRVPDDIVELVRSMHPHLKKKVKASLQAILSDPPLIKEFYDLHLSLFSVTFSGFFTSHDADYVAQTCRGD